MEVFDLKKMEEKKQFFGREEFNMRHIQLPEKGEIPRCEMSSYVIFNVIDGEVEITVDDEEVNLSEGQCLVTEPATLSMRTQKGVKILGIQVSKAE